MGGAACSIAFPVSYEEISESPSPARRALITVLSSRQRARKTMQVHKGKCRKGDVLSLNILEGRASEELMRLLLTHGIEIEIASI